MAGRKLAAVVHVDGTVYPAGASVPAEVAERITNPKAWADAEPEEQDAASDPKPKATGKAKSKPKEPAAPAAPEPTGDDDAELTPPPISGAGSGAKAWLDYAVAAVAKAGLNIEFPDDVKREDIVAALDGAGIATKPKE